MTAVWMYFRAELRGRWRSWLVLALLAGLFGGLVTAVAAGALRTDTAYTGLVAWSRSPDDLISLGPGQGPTFARVPAAAVARLPQVIGAARLTTFTALDPAAITVMAPANGDIPGSFWRRKLLAGRLPDPGQPDQADISFTVAQALHLGVGGRLPVVLLGAAGEPVPVWFRVAGIDAAPSEFPPQYGFGIDVVWATPAFSRQHGRELLATPGIAVRLRRGGADVPVVEGEISRLGGGKAVSDYPLGPQAANTEHSIRQQAVALWLVAGLLAVLSLLVLGQLLARLSRLESTGYGALRAVGMSRAQLAAAGLIRAAVIGAAGAAFAVLLAVAASPAFPVGLAGIAEPRPGVDADWLVLGLGAAGVVLATVGCAAWPAWHAAAAVFRHPAGVPLRGSPAMSVMAGAIPPVSAAMGIRLAVRRGAGRTALPVASTIAAAAVGVTALSAAMVFTASLGNLLATPRLYGVTWDAVVASVQFSGLGPAAQSVARDPEVSAWSGIYLSIPLEIRGVQVGAIAAGQHPGGLLTALPVQGRLPDQPGDIVLGARTLAAIHARIGETVEVSVAGLRRQLPRKITGTAVFPAVADFTDLGTGAELTAAGLRDLVPPSVPLPPFTAVMVRFRTGVGQQEGVGALAARVDRLGPFGVMEPPDPADLVNFGQVQALPLLAGVALGVVALLTIAHLLLTSVRQRRRDLAVLRALGFTRGQIRATVAWQAVTLTGAALVIGIPAGIACGRLAWRFFTGQVGILPVITVPLLSLAILVAAALALAVAVAAVPGESAARTHPADVLRAE
jgi:FtsX-like permease family